MKPIKVTILSMSLLCSFQAFSDGKKLFDYQLILEAQQKCDESVLRDIKYPPKRKAVFLLAKKTRAIFSDLSLKEIASTKERNGRDSRHFELKFTIYAHIGCGKSSSIVGEGEKLGKGEKRISFPIVEEAWKQPEYVDLVDADKPEDIEKPSLSIDFTANDLPPEPGLNGLSCLLEKKQFLKEVPKELAIKICGKNNTQEIIKITEKAIEQTQKAINAAEKK